MKLFFLCLLYGIVQSAEWSYKGIDGVDFWKDRDHTYCNQKRQSPIDIPWKPTYEDFEPFQMEGYTNMQTFGLKVKNNGHTAQMDIATESYGKTKVSGGGLNGTYIAVQLHFHWGADDHEGSEHTFRGLKYPLELHIVHFKESYGTIAEAVQHGDGLAVLGFFFITDDAQENEALKPLIDSLIDIPYKGEQTPVTMDFADLMPATRSHYYRYMGSLTTPECNEVVVWTVFDWPNTISSYQLRQFRELYEYDIKGKKEKIDWNYRPTQPLFGREVYKNYREDVPPSWHWGYEGYEGPKYWKNYHETCSGTRQSPIDLPAVDQLEPFNPSMKLSELEFANYDQTVIGKIKNNGHTVQVDIENEDIHLRKGGLEGTYRAAQFHFHWGHDGQEGSEHTVNNKAYPLELHIVHYNEKYGDLYGAVKRDDGLAVIGVFFEVGAVIKNKNYNKIVTHLPDVKYKDTEKRISGFNLKELINDNLRLNETSGFSLPFYRYLGGLTTPPCSEVVIWTVLKYPVRISQEQLEEFRKVTHIKSGPSAPHDYIKKNFRPPQNLAGRKVYQSEFFEALDQTAGTSGLLPSMLCMAAIFFMVVLL